ncbi:heme biosynthesis HemY N-terminal domain-containing protein [Atopomonas sediminilitoris]|uniref:heme biosynthesis HemY N-terminal domain-containing protein n=1 Tax=Atopomonas sediminilitoris TaxID=2919919 RepID=UPI001F4D5570|nr:heme biosynthesis HemY N-terminal domain-containing protein [Atopomonas sediminilitoris]MCJ8170511.1 heme biosynthesis protein HemY [Atopomonas sediminilitoris]
MRWLIRLFKLLLIAAPIALVAWALTEHPGYVLLSYKQVRFESSLWIFLALLVVLWFVMWGLRLLFDMLKLSNSAFNPWSRHHKNKRIERASLDGFLELAEGRWQRALLHLKKAAEGSRQPLPFYLGAAQAANELGEYDECDALLTQAQAVAPKGDLPLALTRAELLAERGEPAQAVALLEPLRSANPRQPQLLRQLANLYEHSDQWSKLCQLLPELRKQNIFPPAHLDALELEAWHVRLQEAADSGEGEGELSLQPLTQAWQALPAKRREDSNLLGLYAQQLKRLGAGEEAEKVLLKAIDKDYRSDLVALYGQVRGADALKQLKVAEGWLKSHAQDAELLLCLGRLCLRNQLWGKAREYLEASLSFASLPHAVAELARLLVAEGDREGAFALLQKGLYSNTELLDVAMPNA